MDFMSKLKNKADQNRDGKLSKEDLESMRNDNNSGMIDSLKAKADQNQDGKINFDDIKSMM